MTRNKSRDPKKGNRQGSKRQLPSGMWQARISIEEQDGNIRRVTLGTFPTKTEANQAIATALTDAAREEFTMTNKTTLEEYARAWFELKEPTMAAKYALSVKGIMELHVFPALGKRKLSSIKPRDLEQFYASLTSKRKYGKERKALESEVKPLSDASKARIHSVLHQVFTEAVRHSDLLRNPADVGRPQRERKAAQESNPKAWTEEEAAKFYQVARQDRRGVVFCFMLSTGLRVGEALGLRWENVELQAKTPRIHVHEGLVSLRGKAHRTTPKTARSRRSLVVTGDALAILRERSEQARLDQEAQGARYVPSDAVFTNSLGGPILPDTIYALMKRLTQQAGVPYKGTHVLRHSFISIQGQHGRPLEVISAHVGHATPAFTQNRYRTVFEKEREAMTLDFPSLSEPSENEE